MKELVTVVIPVFDHSLTDAETASLNRCFDLLGTFPVQFITGNHTDLGKFDSDYYGFETYRYDDVYFADREGFSRLLLSPDFYGQFGWSEFIFIFEPGAYLVKNELRHWCRQAYDFIQLSPQCPSLRRVEKFEKRAKKQQEVLRYLQSGPVSDFAFWQEKAAGFLSGLRTPPGPVAKYYAQLRSGKNEGLPESVSPFILL